MSQRVAYISGFYRNREREDDIKRGVWPNPDYSAFVRRNDIALVTYSEAEAANPALTRALADNNSLYSCPIEVVFAPGHRYDAIVASGEDVGLPLAVHANAHGILTPIFIVTHGFLVNH